MTDVTETTAPEGTEAEAGAKRGRPRPAATIERDKMVLDQVSGEGSTREELVNALTAAGTPLDKSAVYLSLYRLRKDGLVERSREGSSHKWRKTAQPTG